MTRIEHRHTQRASLGRRFSSPVSIPLCKHTCPRQPSLASVSRIHDQVRREDQVAFDCLTLALGSVQSFLVSLRVYFVHERASFQSAIDRDTVNRLVRPAIATVTKIGAKPPFPRERRARVTRPVAKPQPSRPTVCAPAPAGTRAWTVQGLIRQLPFRHRPSAWAISCFRACAPAQPASLSPARSLVRAPAALALLYHHPVSSFSE